MPRCLFALCLVATALATVPFMQKSQCTVGQLFSTPHSAFVQICKQYNGFKYSKIIGCRNSEGGLTEFGKHYDLYKGDFSGFRYACQKTGSRMSYYPSHCLIGKDRKVVGHGQEVVDAATSSLCHCGKYAISCRGLP